MHSKAERRRANEIFVLIHVETKENFSFFFRKQINRKMFSKIRDKNTRFICSFSLESEVLRRYLIDELMNYTFTIHKFHHLLYTCFVRKQYRCRAKLLYNENLTRTQISR